MKIDIHTHTKKTKSGDSEKRNVSTKDFNLIIAETEVEIIAITNHNHFDLEQFNDFVNSGEGSYQIWPGVELDVLEEERKGHLLVVVNPKQASEFSRAIKLLLEGTTEDDFQISIDKIIDNFDKFDAIYIPHYYSKKPDLNDDDIKKLVSGLANNNRVIKEATNAISAGVYISHGHKTIYGSDIQDWGDYISIAKTLPDLRLPVESFEQFCLLLEKDETTIKTILEAKIHDEITLKPFDDGKTLTIDIYNDINVLFGSKGTGKTEILKAISKYYNANGLDTNVYVSSAENLDGYYDIKGKTFNIDLSELNIESCNTEIGYLKNTSDEKITLISNYFKFYSTEIVNKRAKAIKIKEFDIIDTVSLNKKFEDIKSVKEYLGQFKKFLETNQVFKSVINKKMNKQLLLIIEKIYGLFISEQEIGFQVAKSTQLFNSLIRVFKEEISKKTGTPTKPNTTGFMEYARKRIKIEKSVLKIITSIESKIPPLIEEVGDLDEKGNLQFITKIVIQNGDITDSDYITLKGLNKTPQKEFSSKLYSIYKSIYDLKLFERIAELKQINDIEKITDIDDLIMFFRHFAIEGNLYKPSNGESSMVLLHKELSADKDIYLLDEPEKSLGNDYISDVIVPLIKEKAKIGKKVILATHDANIAVRTLPYNSIYRKHDINAYSTYIGNPFSNYLTCVDNSSDNIDWKEISMKTLEGGKDAFGERGKIYGN